MLFRSEYEKKAEETYQNARADYYNGVETRQRKVEEKTEKERLNNLKKAHDSEKAENEKWIKDLNSSYASEQKENEKRLDQQMLNESKKQKQLASIRKEAESSVSEENILSSNAKRQNQLNDYYGQSSEHLENAKVWNEEIINSQNKLKSLISNNASLEKIEAEFNNLTSATKEFNNSMSVVKETMEKSLSSTSIDKAKQSVENIRDTYKDFLSESQLKELNKISDSYSEGLTSSNKDSLDTRALEIKKEGELLKQLASIRKEAESGIFDVRNAKIDTSLSRYTGQDSEVINKLRANAKQVKDTQEEITTALNEKTVDSTKVTSLYEKLSVATEKYGNSLKVVKELESATLGASEAEIASNKVKTYMENNTRALKKYGVQLEDIANRYKEVKTVGDKLDIDTDFKKIQSQISAEGLTGKSFIQDFKRAFGQISQFTGVYAIAQNVLQDAPRALIEAVKEVNAAQIELRKVSEASNSQLASYWDQAADSAKKYGATISDVISSTADWSRLGYNLEDAKQLSDMTTLLQRVGDNMTQETSSEGLISTLRGFELNADKAQHIVDVANEIANTQPIDTSGIFNALERSASSLNAAGNTFEQGVALATAANSVVQDADKIGTAMKTISMRIRGANTELEEAGLDTEGMATSTSKLRAEIKALSGVDIMKNANEFKSTYDILDELSDKWSSLTDIQQASVTELIAGGRENLARIYRNINKRTYLIARAA